MNIKVAGLAATILLLGSIAGVVYAGGNSPGHLGSKGWDCMNAGPKLFVHCFPPGSGASSASLMVKAFATEDLESTDAEFLGTELLIRADLYHGQPCPQDNSLEYLPVDLDDDEVTDYYACHHFERPFETPE